MSNIKLRCCGSTAGEQRKGLGGKKGFEVDLESQALINGKEARSTPKRGVGSLSKGVEARKWMGC